MPNPDTRAVVTQEQAAWDLLCKRLQRDPATSEEDETCSLRAAWKAMLAFRTAAEARVSAREEVLVRVLGDLERAASAVHRKGAVTGPQWSRLSGSLISARAALNTDGAGS